MTTFHLHPAIVVTNRLVQQDPGAMKELFETALSHIVGKLCPEIGLRVNVECTAQPFLLLQADSKAAPIDRNVA